MSPASNPPDRMPGAWVTVLAVGLLTGAFWLFWTYLLLLRQPVPWWQYPVSLAPGAAVLFLVLLARHHPLPYGSALLALGVLSLILGRPFAAWALRLAFGFPVAAVGLGFMAYSTCRFSGSTPNAGSSPGA